MQETQETQVHSPGREDPLEQEMAPHSSILAWEIPWTEELEGYSPQGHKESDTTERTQQIHVPLSLDMEQVAFGEEFQIEVSEMNSWKG